MHGTYAGSYTWFDACVQFCKEESPSFERRLCHNIHASFNPHTHIITWSRDDADTDIAACVARIQPGDMIQVLAMAAFPGWTNYVQAVEIEISSVGERDKGLKEK